MKNRHSKAFSIMAAVSYPYPVSTSGKDKQAHKIEHASSRSMLMAVPLKERLQSRCFSTNVELERLRSLYKSDI